MNRWIVATVISGLIIYFLAVQSQIGWLYLFDAIIWSLLILSIVMSWHSLRSLQVEREVLLPRSSQWQLGGPMEDGTVEVRLKITNRGRLARHFIKLVEDCPFDHPDKRRKAFLIASIKPRATTSFTYQATCYRRGYYPAAAVTVQSGGPLGLVVRRRTLPLPLNLAVYPCFYPMVGLPVSEAVWADWGHGVRSNVADEFYGSREYRYGDPLKHIHWRNTARLGDFMLKEFEQARQGSVTVVFDNGQDYGKGRETTLEYSIKIAASLARLCADSGRSIDILVGEKPRRGAGWPEAMEFLAHLETTGKSCLAGMVDLAEKHQPAVVIIPAVATEFIPVLSRLASQMAGTVVVLLEGFVSGEKVGEFSHGLSADNLEIINCSPGDLEAALQKLNGSPLFRGKSITMVT